MHAVVKKNDIELRIAEDQFNFLKQYRVSYESRGGEARHERFSSELLFHLGIVIACYGVADEEDARKIGFVRMRDPDVTPFDGFTRGRTFSTSEIGGESDEDGERQKQVLYKNGCSKFQRVISHFRKLLVA